MKVLIIMGSVSDEPIMQESSNWLKWFGIPADMVVASAHRDPDRVRDLMVNARQNGYGAVIAAAGMAAALPGVCAAYTSLPVFGVPLEGGLPGGIDALYSIVQ
ncbi:MAG: AIR carboxylase family protein, partial [Chitinophagia bacterium]|nr:AIR carboxylase family protein [Chitinophagia bacterium]